MANTDGGTLTLRSFAQLSGPHQRAVVLKSQGATHEIVAQTLQDEFQLTTTKNTVNQWFASGGLLEQALNETKEKLAEEGLREARLVLKRASLPAAVTLVRLLNDPNPLIQLRASMAILNKYIPDRQIVPTEHIENDLPEELSEIADRIMIGSTEAIAVGS